jgi:hypothetical protein
MSTNNNERPCGMVIVLQTPEGLALKGLAERRGYSLPRKQTPWMEKELGDLVARVTRDDEKRLWSLRLSGTGVRDHAALARAVRTVVEDLQDVVDGLDVKGVFYVADGKIDVAGLMELGYQNGTAPMGDGTVTAHVKVEDGQIRSGMSGRLGDGSNLIFFTDALLHDLNHVGGLQG